MRNPVPLSRSLLASLAALVLATAAARADWLDTDLPFRDYLGGPVSGLAPAGPADLWAVSAYAYRYQDEEHARWNSIAWRSLNGGRLWDLPWDAPTGAEPADLPFQDTQLFAASFAGRDTGFLFGWRRPGFDLSDPPGPYAFYRTTDRGRTWTVTTLPNSEPSAPEEPDLALDAVDATHAVAVQGRHVFETSDGATWRERAGSYPRLFSVQAGGLPAPRVAGTDGGRAVAGALTQGGFTADLTAGGVFRATRFADPDHGWVAGDNDGTGVIYGTADGGGTWDRQASVPGVVFRALAAGSASRAWAVGERVAAGKEDDSDRGVIYGTADGGKTWALERYTPGRLVSAAARGPYHAWAGGEDGVYRYVPALQAPPGDLDRSGQIDTPDIAGILGRAGGLSRTDTGDLDTAGIPTITGAVEALRGALALDDPLPAEPGRRAVVVYNTRSADANSNGIGDSEEVARYYASRRGVPDDHLVPITWADPGGFGDSAAGRGNWTDAFEAVILPLRERLEAIGRDTVDTIVFTLGVPYNISVAMPDGSRDMITLDAASQDLYAADAENWSSENPYAAPFGPIAERYGRYPFGAGGRPMGQPVTAGDGSVSRGPYYLVGRVDGPDVETCRAMVDNALFAERHHGAGGYRGIAYIDNRARHYNSPTLRPYTLEDLRDSTPAYRGYATYDKSIARTLLTFEDRGYPWRDEVTYVSIGEAGATFRNGEPADAAPRAMFYAGWYNFGRYFDVFEWLPGSVGIDFDSASAAFFRNGRFFAGGALAAGLTALVGVRDEPYIYHPKPDALMEYLARGYRLGEAAALATETPRLARHLVLGDPLYRPFGGPAEPVPIPKLDTFAVPGPEGWTVTLESDVPVRATLLYASGGADPGEGGLSVPGVPAFYARRHAFTVPAGEDMQAVVRVTDPTGRVTTGEPFLLP